MAHPYRFAKGQILFPCTAGAVHTWHEATATSALNLRSLLGELRTWMDLRPPGLSVENDVVDGARSRQRIALG